MVSNNNKTVDIYLRDVNEFRRIWNSKPEMTDIFDATAFPDYIIACLTKHLFYPRRIKLVAFFWFNGITFDQFVAYHHLIREQTYHRPNIVSQRMTDQQYQQLRGLWRDLDDRKYLDTYFTWSIHDDQYVFLNGQPRQQRHERRRRDTTNPNRTVMPPNPDRIINC